MRILVYYNLAYRIVIVAFVDVFYDKKYFCWRIIVINALSSHIQ